jgi:hypothetical protein
VKACNGLSDVELYSQPSKWADRRKGAAGDNSWGVAALLRFQFEDSFSVTEFGSHFVIPLKSVPDKKSGDDQEDNSKDKNCQRERGESVLEHKNLLSSRR